MLPAMCTMATMTRAEWKSMRRSASGSSIVEEPKPVSVPMISEKKTARMSQMMSIAPFPAFSFKYLTPFKPFKPLGATYFNVPGIPSP